MKLITILACLLPLVANCETLKEEVQQMLQASTTSSPSFCLQPLDKDCQAPMPFNGDLSNNNYKLCQAQKSVDINVGGDICVPGKMKVNNEIVEVCSSSTPPAVSPRTNTPTDAPSTGTNVKLSGMLLVLGAYLSTLNF